MYSRHLALGLSALASLAFVAGTASAGDNVRLSLPGGASAPTIDLKATPDDLAADATPTRLVRGAVHGVARGVVAHRGYYGGYRGYYGYPSYASYYYPRAYVSTYYYPTPVYYAPQPACYPISGTAVGASYSTTVGKVMPPADILNAPYTPRETLPAPRPQGQTFPYDGDLGQPLPQAEPFPTRNPTPLTVPPPTVPLDGRPVSLPARTAAPAKLSYAAYGELPRTTPLPDDRFLPIKK